MTQALPRCTPEQVGIASGTVERLLDALEATGTEMHGLMIARHGKVCAEGWWAPYSPHLVHGLQSLTKTYTITALGLLHDEGKLELSEKLVDIFPQYLPENVSDNLRAMTVRDLMSFSSGLNQMGNVTEPDWLRRFFAQPVVDRPGTKFFYSGECTAVGGAIVRERTGMGLLEYLTPRLFDKIGIDASRLKTFYTGDGLEYGGGGLFATTEDNLRLMMLYAQDGMWDGARVLSAEWCAAVRTKHTETAPDADPNAPRVDSMYGYGLQCWMCRPEGSYRADGAMGQYAIVVPTHDLVISINETANRECMQVLNALWTVLLPGIQDAPLAPDDAAYAHLTRRLRSLALPRPLLQRTAPCAAQVSGKRYRLADNEAILLPGTTFLSRGMETRGVRDIAVHFDDADTATLCWTQNDVAMQCRVSLNGNAAVNRGKYGPAGLEWLHALGGWSAPDTFCVHLRMVETCFTKIITLRFAGDACTLSIRADLGGLGEATGVLEIAGTAVD